MTKGAREQMITKRSVATNGDETNAGTDGRKKERGGAHGDRSSAGTNGDKKERAGNW